MSANNDVDNVTDSLAKTTLADDNSNEVQKANGDNHEEAVAAGAADGRRVYVGNLAYATTEEQLKDFFKDFSV